MDIKSTESTFLSINQAIAEYFDGDRHKFIELAIARFVIVWINQAGLTVPIGKPREYAVIRAEDIPEMEKVTLQWFTPISSDVAQRFLRRGTTAIYWAWYRPRHLALDDEGKYITFNRIGHLPDHDRVAWFATNGYKQPIPTDFDTAYVGRKALQKAMADYFNIEEPSQPERTSKWPWGEYETTLLQHLAAAAREFWSDYVPGGQAPKKDVVVQWLKEEPRKVSQRSAEAIDTILRAENLPPGPRPRTSARHH